MDYGMGGDVNHSSKRSLLFLATFKGDFKCVIWGKMFDCVFLSKDDGEENAVGVQADTSRQLAGAPTVFHWRPTARPHRPAGVALLLCLDSHLPSQDLYRLNDHYHRKKITLTHTLLGTLVHCVACENNVWWSWLWVLPVEPHVLLLAFSKTQHENAVPGEEAVNIWLT